MGEEICAGVVFLQRQWIDGIRGKLCGSFGGDAPDGVADIVGHQHGATPQNIVGAIANEAGIESRYIGRIEIHDEYSTVDLPAGMPEEIFQHLKKVRVRQYPLNISRLDGPRPERKRPGPKPTTGEKAPRSARRNPADQESRPASRRQREINS